MSAYIKSIDSNHLVGLGDEGWINDPGNSDYPYQGNSIGIDFAANLAINSIDFGTFHVSQLQIKISHKIRNLSFVIVALSGN